MVVPSANRWEQRGAIRATNKQLKKQWCLTCRLPTFNFLRTFKDTKRHGIYIYTVRKKTLAQHLLVRS